MITSEKLIADFERMYREGWAYRYGAAQTGAVDCAGAFVWAFREQGGSIYHGSNRIAREYVAELLPIALVKPGMAVFKTRRPGDERYALPGIYRAGGSHYTADQTDYYHIGLADSDPAFVLNARSEAAGFARTPAEEWDVCGYLRGVDYGSAEQQAAAADVARITLPEEKRGETVNLRAAPGGRVLRQLRDGTAVRVLARDTAWTRVVWETFTGYVMTDFLHFVGEAERAACPDAGLAERVSALEEAVFGEANGRQRASGWH